MRMLSATAILPILLLAACDQGAGAHGDAAKAIGSGGERRYEVGSFDRVSLAGPYDVVVAVGGAPSVRAVGDSEALDRLEVRVSGGELIVGTHRGLSWSFGSGHRATVYVTAPALKAAAVAGSGDMKVDKVRADRFEAAVSGSGDLDIGALEARDARLSIAGSGNLKLAGGAETANVSVVGSGDVSGPKFQAADASVEIAGSGNAELRATRTARIKIAGSGDVDIKGGAKCEVSKAGSGSANCA